MVQFQGLVTLARGGPRFQGLAAQGKWCAHCARDLPLSEFYRYPWRDKRHDPPRERMRYSPYCKPCMAAVATAFHRTPQGKERARERYRQAVSADPEAWRLRWRVYNERRRQKRGGTARPKGMRRCKRCGESKPLAAFGGPKSYLCSGCRSVRPKQVPEERRARHMLSVKRWREKNPEKWREINRRATRAYEARKRQKKKEVL